MYPSGAQDLVQGQALGAIRQGWVGVDFFVNILQQITPWTVGLSCHR